MKKVTYLLLVMFATILLTTSCEKDEPVTPDTSDDGIMTLAQLDGQWNFESYLYDGIELNCNNYDKTTDIDNIFLNLEFDIKNGLATRVMSCDNKKLPSKSFTKTGNSLEIYKHSFTIISYKTKFLKLRLDETTYDFDFDGGILTLIKQ